MKICPVCTQAFPVTDVRCPHDGVALVSLDTGVSVGTGGDLTGQVIDGRYRVDGVIGRGGMGLVYSCHHVVVGKRFAMKVLKPGMERAEDVLARFIREAQSANAVRSPHIAESSDFGQLPSGHFFVVMELLEGMSFAAALKQRLLTRDQLLFVFTQMADTLEHTHRAGIVHRDLKPDNVFLVHDPHDEAPHNPNQVPLFVKLLDFGVAKLMGSNEAGLTQSGVILGTPYYMAPEQARGQAIDHRVDIYSLGVMMYHAFTGRLPFVADSAVAVLTAHAIDLPARPSTISAVDPGIEQVILRCLEKRPEDRFATMHEIAECLRQLRRIGNNNFGLPPAQSGAFTRIDTQSGQSLTGPHASMAARLAVTGPSAAAQVPQSSGKLVWAFAGLSMLLLGGVAAFALISKSNGKSAGGSASASTVSAPATPPPAAPPPAASTAPQPVATPTASSASTSSASESAQPASSAQPSSSASPAPSVAAPQFGGPAPRTGPVTPPNGKDPNGRYSPEIRDPFLNDK